MITIETMTYSEKHELRARERHWIETLKSSLNTQIPTRTIEEWIALHRDEIIVRKREYHQANKEVIHQKKKQYYLDHVAEICQKVQDYRDADPERAKAQNRQKYLNCQDRIKAYRSTKIICECGMEYTRTHGDRHRNTARHAALLSAKIIPPSDIVPVPEPDLEHAAYNSAPPIQLSKN